MSFLYALLIRLNPPSFRKRFAQEMLWIFDETAIPRVLLIRSELWKWFVAGIAGAVPLIIAFGSFLPWDRPLHP